MDTNPYITQLIMYSYTKNQVSLILEEVWDNFISMDDSEDGELAQIYGDSTLLGFLEDDWDNPKEKELTKEQAKGIIQAWIEADLTAFNKVFIYLNAEDYWLGRGTEEFEPDSNVPNLYWKFE